MRFFLILLTLFFVCILIDVTYSVTPLRLDEIKEEDIVGLEEFLEGLHPDVRDAVLDLLDAKQIPDQETANEQMRTIMRTLPRKTQEDLFNLFVNTMRG